MKVLLAEDDIGMRAMLEELLSGGGFEVRAVETSAQALNLLRSEPFDWLVTDGFLGKESGLELAKAADKLRPGIRIVLISGWYGEKDIAGLPIEKHFIKPLNNARLLAYLRGDSPPSA